MLYSAIFDSRRFKLHSLVQVSASPQPDNTTTPRRFRTPSPDQRAIWPTVYLSIYLPPDAEGPSDPFAIALDRLEMTNLCLAHLQSEHGIAMAHFHYAALLRQSGWKWQDATQSLSGPDDTAPAPPPVLQFDSPPRHRCIAPTRKHRNKTPARHTIPTLLSRIESLTDAVERLAAATDRFNPATTISPPVSAPPQPSPDPLASALEHNLCPLTSSPPVHTIVAPLDPLPHDKPPIIPADEQLFRDYVEAVAAAESFDARLAALEAAAESSPRKPPRKQRYKPHPDIAGLKGICKPAKQKRRK